MESEFMAKAVDLNRTVYELCHDNPEAVEILVSLGFQQIANKNMLNTAGRFMTLPKGAELKKIDLGEVRAAFREKGYLVKN